MTTYDPKARRLLTESETRAEMISDSLRELRASRKDITRECAGHAHALKSAQGTLRDIDGMIATLRAQLHTLPVKECDCCGEMRGDCISVAHPSFGDTTACAACRGDFDEDPYGENDQLQWEHETNGR